MKRPAGVVASAIVLGLVGLLQIVLALGMAAAVVVSRGEKATVQQPAWVGGMMWAVCAMFVLVSAWSIATTIGVFRLRQWARVSILVIGGCMALFGGISMIIFVAMMFVPLPGQAYASSPQEPAMVVMRVIFGVFVLFYAAMAGVGVWWLVYFSRKKARAAFAGEAGELVESRRPLLISALAVLCLIGAVSCVLLMFMPLPGAFLGMIFRGWQKVALYLVFASVSGASGIGLWKLKEWARRLQLALLALGVVNYVVMMLRPGLMAAYQAEVQQKMYAGRPELAMPGRNAMYFVIFGASMLVMIGIAAVLHHYRERFCEPVVEVQPSLPPESAV